MFRRIWLFIATFCLFLGLEILAVHSISLTSEATEYFARKDQEVVRKQWWFEALTGNKLEFPEQEIEIKPYSAYILLAFSGIGFMHSLFIIKDEKTGRR